MDTPTVPQAPSMEKIKETMRATWMSGDFGVIAKTLAVGAEDLIARLSLPPGPCRLLDVACGTGNLAIPAARAGATVTGVDISPNLLVQARERAVAEGMAIVFDEGDAEALPYADASFDVVVTMFGAMFAPRPELVASELARVLRPGGLLAMGNWTPGGFTGKMFRLGAQFAPPPPGIAPPVLWGDDAAVRTRLQPGFSDIRTEVIPVDFDLPLDAAGCVAFFREYYGPTQAAFNRLDSAKQTEFAAALEELWATHNAAEDPANHMVAATEYLLVLATRRMDEGGVPVAGL